MEKLPIYDVIINDDDESGVDFISLVDEPAMEMSWLKFSTDSLVEQDFSIDKDKKMLYGVFIAADKLVYRVDELRGEYYSRFKKDQIGKIIKKFNKNNFNRNINFQHGDNIVKAYVVDNFQTSDLIKADFGYDVPDGSWAGSVYIEDDEFWKDYVKTGSLKGFSVELRSRLLKANFSLIENDGDAALSWSERFLNSDEYRSHLIKDILKSDFSDMSKRKLITDILSSKKEKYYTLRLTPNSSNSDVIEYETEKKELRIKFNDGSTYLYENVEYRIFEKVWLGDAKCKTSGTSPYGSWEVGDSPSVGAAIHKYLVKRGFNGRRI